MRSWKALLPRQTDGSRRGTIRTRRARLEFDGETLLGPADLPALIDHLRNNPKAEVVVGPWISELGFELLYWIPFLRWLLREAGTSRKNVTVVSRGGVDHWYARIATHYVDIFDTISLERFRALNAERATLNENNSQKHHHYSELDRVALEPVLADRPNAVLIHPSLMYALFQPHWSAEAGSRDVLSRRKTKPFGPPPDTGLDLPDDFVAVKFYDRPSFPWSEENQRLVERLVERVAARRPVVSLSLPYQPDDHPNFVVPDMPNVTHVGHLLPEARNLAVQSEIIARSRGLVGTYGGFSYLPMMFGRPAVGIVVRDRAALAIHYEMASHTARRLGTTCTILHAAALDLL